MAPKLYADAVQARNALRPHVERYRSFRDEQEAAAAQRERQRIEHESRRAMDEKLVELNARFKEMHKKAPQPRGYDLEALLNDLFALFDVDARSPFRVVGEQIDGAFTLEGNEFLLEAKWEAKPTPTADLDAFAGKIGRKLDNTLGLFVSMSGFQQTAISHHSQARSVMILMDGMDLSIVLEGRIELPRLLLRKRQHAARTGEILLPAHVLLLDS
jgi:hypothetical protein